MATDAETAARVDEIVAALSVEQKVAQLVGLWAGADTGDGQNVAPMQMELMADVGSFEDYAAHGLGRLDRMYGTRPIEATAAARSVSTVQRYLTAHPPGIAALVQEECLVGVMTCGATVFPSPLAWGATFHPELIEELGTAIGASMRSAGIHLGLGPVLDVVVDSRWGRTEECIGEDPYLIGILGSAYIVGLQSQRVVGTAKHFAGHAASLGARNQGPVSIGPRELADVHLVPFEMAIRLGQVRSVMHSYAGVDGIAPAGSRWLLTEVLRDRFGFDGFVVADFLGITFLHTHHRVADSLEAAGMLALTAGCDMELTNAQCFPLVGQAITAGRCDESILDQAVGRVLRAKVALGLLDGEGDPQAEPLDLDPPAHRALARRVAEESVVLLANDGLLPLAAAGGSIAVVGPLADFARALVGDYAFPNHVEERFDVPPGIAIPTVLARLVEEFAGRSVTHAAAGTWEGSSDAELEDAVAVAARADVIVAVVGDKAGLFGRGTVGEGTDVTSLRLPHRQQELVERLLDTGKPVVLVVVSGRGYALDCAKGRAGAIVQAFFPGQEGASAIAGVLSGRINPSGRLPLSMPLAADASPYTYRQSPYGTSLAGSSVATGALFPFGFGLSYTTFAIEDATISAATMAVDGSIDVSVTVRNTGRRDGADVVQLYAQDLYATVVRPLTELVGFARVRLSAGAVARVTFTVAADRLSFTGVDLQRIVEPGEVVFRVGRSAEEIVAEWRVAVTGQVRVVDSGRQLVTGVRTDHLPAPTS